MIAMAYDEKVLTEELERLGLTMWVGKRPFGCVKNGGLLGGPKCTNCEREFSTGLTFKGNGSLCRECLDHLRQLLFKFTTQGFKGIDTVGMLDLIADGLPSRSGES